MTTVRCPNCEATYNIDAAKLVDGGRKLRCAKCQTVWLATAEPATPEPVAVPVEAVAEAPVPEDVVAVVLDILASEDLAAEPADGDVAFAPPSEDVMLQRTPGVDAVVKVGGWRQFIRGDNVWRTVAVVLVCVGILLGCGVFWWNFFVRDTGMPTKGHAVVAVAAEPKLSAVVQPPKGIILHRVRSEVKELGDKDAGVSLTVRGLLTNTTKEALTVPPLRLELLGKDGQVADMWPVSGVAATLAPQEEQAWAVSLTAPDMSSIQGWRVVFVSDKPAKASAAKASEKVAGAGH